MRLGSESGISYLKRESIKMCLFFFLTRENQNKMTLLHYCLYVLEGELETRLGSELPVDLTAKQLGVCMWAAENEG